MLTVREDQCRKGIGKMLLREAETRAIKHGCEKMQLYVLTSHEFVFPFKDLLHTWYDKLGYNIVGEIEYAELHPVDAKRTNYHMVLM